MVFVSGVCLNLLGGGIAMEKTNIPKVIHYCWFGNNAKSELILKCIESWRKYLPDFEIIEWNETNFDVNCCSYT